MSGIYQRSWPVRRLRFLIRYTPTEERYRRLSEASQVTFLPMEAISEQGELDLSAVRDIDDVKIGYTRFFDGDVVIAKITPCFENGKGAFIQDTLNGVGFGTTELHVLSPGPELDGRFLYYITASDSFRKLGEAQMTGAAGQKRVPEEFVRNYKIFLPPLLQQRAMADFLDQETAQIDALVTAKERLLTLLAEKRRALITRVVTRGLNSDVPLRDSGIPWLGEIPEHWRVERLRWLIRTIEQGWSPQAEEREPEDDGWGVLKLNAVKSGAFDDTKTKALPADLVIPKQLEVRSGDFLVTRANTPELVGDICFVKKTRPRRILSDLIYRLHLDHEKIDGEFLSFFLLSPTGRSQIEADARGSSGSMVKISQEHISNWSISFPPLPEQRAIVTHIISETAKLDALRSATEHTIALLKERRAALIAAAVTGKIDINGKDHFLTEACHAD